MEQEEKMVETPEALDLNGLAEKLRKHTTKWNKAIVKQIKENAEIDLEIREAVNNIKIWNILANKVRDQQWKVFLYAQMKILLKKYEDQLTKVLK